MEDSAIIELYWQRSEQAIAETQTKYGAFCYSVALNLLRIPEDAEECVSDTYHAAWNAMPPQRPEKLRAWLGRVTRNLSLSLWNRNHRAKRSGGIPELLDELEDCLPAPETAETALEARELARAIDAWLSSLRREDRVLFLGRYWNGLSIQELAFRRGMKPEKLSLRLFRLRQSLRGFLEKEGYVL
ncbi:MAG: sigma-70 family RNA polymerase sigma factor [Oscillospiraceae bacterium]|nr:sigma-70 family RNA polymerase sigma factor [Oscillospiraceae bacterium]